MGISRSKYVAITSSLRLGFGLALAPSPDEGGGVPVNAVRNNQGGYVRNSSGGYVLRSF